MKRDQLIFHTEKHNQGRSQTENRAVEGFTYVGLVAKRKPRNSISLPRGFFLKGNTYQLYYDAQFCRITRTHPWIVLPTVANLCKLWL